MNCEICKEQIDPESYMKMKVQSDATCECCGNTADKYVHVGCFVITKFQAGIIENISDLKPESIDDVMELTREDLA